MRGEVVDVDQRRHQGRAGGRQAGDEVLGEAGAVFDGVDAGVDQVGQRLLAEGVHRHPGPGLVGPLHGVPEGVGRATAG